MYIYVLIGLFLSTSAYCQSVNVDSLNRVIDISSINDFNHWGSKMKLANYYVYHNLDTATLIIDSVLIALSDEDLRIKTPQNYYKHLVVKAWTSHGNEKLDEAIYYLNMADSIVSLTDDRSARIEIQINLGALYVSKKDTSAVSFVNNFLSEIDTTYGNRDEKIAWVLGKKYMGQIYENKGYQELAFNEYKDVIESGLLEELPNFRVGVIKCISGLAAFSGNHSYAISSLKALTTNANLYTYQNGDINHVLLKNYISIDSIDSALELSDQILKSDNLNNNLKFRTYATLAELSLSQGNIEVAKRHIDKLSSMITDIESSRFQHQLCLLKAKYHLLIGNRDLCRHQLDSTPTVSLSQANKLKYGEINLLNTLDVNQVIAYNELDSLRRAIAKQKLQSRIQELMIIHETEIEKNRNIGLTQELNQAKKIEKQKNNLLFLFGLLGISALITLVLIAKNLKLSKKYSLLLAREKAVETENQSLIFKNNELIMMNENLKSQKVKANLKANNELIEDKIEFKSLDKLYMLDSYDISRVIAEAGGLRIYANGKSYWTKMTLKQFLDNDNSRLFLRIYRSTVVNISKIKWVNHTSLMMNDGMELKVGRTYRNEIIDALNE